ncbi:MAG: NAD(P)/FAD-dependent oxidoreductase [Dehalococcoidales bacterium]|nr:MAG: NAD(P)/FAD-dependent oxidoreductase [Dehalococcoidales bacterium]
MSNHSSYNAVVIGSGPNGLAAAITAATAGMPVTVYEQNHEIGGACRSTELIRSGLINDIGAAVHPLALISPFFRNLPLEQYGLHWIVPEIAMAHPFEDGTAAALYRAISETSATLGSEDSKAYTRLMAPIVGNGQDLVEEILYLPRVTTRHPLALMNFGTKAVRSVKGLAEKWFRGKRAKGFIAGLGVHSVMDLNSAGSMAPGLVLAFAAHIAGWPLPRGGSQKIPDALSKYLFQLGGQIRTDCKIQSLEEIQPYSLLLMDLTPEQIIKIAGEFMPASYTDTLKNYRYGPGVFKIDWILSEAIPWKAYECRKAPTVHVGGNYEEIVSAEHDVMEGRIPEKPFVFLVQPSIIDTTRTRKKGHVAWAYCHVPNGSTISMVEKIEDQIERYAPGFKDIITARHTMFPEDVEKDNPNCVGGDITAGRQSLRRMIFPELSCTTPLKNMFLCSAVISPGPGVHGMCGVRASRTAMRKLFGNR